MHKFATRFLFTLLAAALIATPAHLRAQKAVGGQSTQSVQAQFPAERSVQSVPIVRMTTSQIMSQPAPIMPQNLMELRMQFEGQFEEPERETLPQNPESADEPQYPADGGNGGVPKLGQLNPSPFSPQVLGTSFDGATGPTETGAFPPDVMGAVGPSQFVVFINGRLRSFNKSTGLTDGVLNVNPDVFFASVLTPPGSGQVTFTSDPNVRYDRLSGRWFLTIIDVTLNSTTGAIAVRRNRTLIAVSDGPTLSGATVWTFYFYQDPTNFVDYPSLGIDANALYIGGDMFNPNTFQGTNGYVIPKAPLLTGSPASVFLFTNLATATGAGPFAPRGVDNYDPANTGAGAIGYFIGADNATFGTLMLRRVTNPGAVGGSPTISANVSITVTATQFPLKVPHLGNTGGTNGRLDALDDRLYAAHLRNGRLWTAHNIGVNNTGTTSGTRTRNGSRWYELQNLNGAPSVVQSGTLFNNTTVNDVNQRYYWIPSIMVSGQGHAALGCSIAGTNERINCFTTGRLSGDGLGTLRDGSGLGSLPPGYTASSTAYNPPSDPGGTGGRRWGDYSFTSVDPLDDMTMWTIQEYCNGANTYGVRAIKLIAPPPATPSASSPGNVACGQASVNVTITGSVISGSGFFDPGNNLASPALAFNHISASISGGVVVNSVTYNSPTSVTLNLNTTGAANGTQTVTIKNPDGQLASGAVLTISPVAPTISCPGDISVSNATNLCSATVSYGSPSVTGCPAPSVTCTPPSGSSFPVGSTTVNCTATNAGGSASCSFTVKVKDTQPPTANCPPSIVTTTSTGADNVLGDCQAKVDYVASSSDNCPGSTINCSPASGSFFPKGTTTVNCTAADAAANIGSCSFTVTVNDDENPVASCPGNIVTTTSAGSDNVSGDCQAKVDYLATSSDNCPGSTINCTPASGSYFPKGATTVNCTATDAVGNTGSCSFTVTVNDDENPVANCPGNIVTTTSTGADNVSGDCQAKVDFVATSGDNCPGSTITCTPASGSYFPKGTTTVNCTATDAAGNSGNCSFTVSVSDDENPSISCPSNITSLTDPFLCTAVQSFAPGATDNCPGVTTSCTPPSGTAFPIGTTTVNCTATDAAGHTANCSFTVTVNNPSPAVSITGPPAGSLYAVGTPVTFSGSFTDNSGDTHTATWTFDAISVAGSVNEGAGTVSAMYTFATPGVYNVTLKVTDQCNGSSTASTVGGITANVVIYDPNAGFVTGGGWINSPPGSFVANPSLGSVANFGFVSQYKKGATIPTGETEFQYQVGSLNFHSTSYEWLVVAGARAQYKGSGTINNGGDYGFMLTATDGQISGGGGLDKFRIKIYNKSTGGIIYDNQLGAPDSCAPTTALGGGSIVIHSSSGGGSKSGSSAGMGRQSADENLLPAEFALHQNYPNPFNPTTEIKFDLPEATTISLKIYNIFGQLVKTLAEDNEYGPGRFGVTFDASGMASGVYIYQLTTSSSFNSTRKMVLLR